MAESPAARTPTERSRRIFNGLPLVAEAKEAQPLTRLHGPIFGVMSTNLPQSSHLRYGSPSALRNSRIRCKPT